MQPPKFTSGLPNACANAAAQPARAFSPEANAANGNYPKIFPLYPFGNPANACAMIHPKEDTPCSR